VFSFLNKEPKPLIPAETNEAVVAAIKKAELSTSGEIRVYIETKCKFVDPLDRAKEVFITLKMEKTVNRNAVLIYLAIKDQQMAIFADEGIHQKMGVEFWKAEIEKMKLDFRQSKMTNGLLTVIEDIGNSLKDNFPYHNEDKNELPDTIVFGK
jgi:uncharacterized membrane protein